jgi:hypothetical protein
MYLYSGLDLIFRPQHWYGFVPQWFSRFVLEFTSVDVYLKLQGVVEVAFALVLLLWFLPKSLVRIVAALSALEMLAILVFTGLDPITFRDLGLLGASAALFVSVSRSNGTNIQQ